MKRLRFAVLVDATLIRMVLVSASMKPLGDRNWYLARWLRWLPDLRVEGDLRPIRLRRRGEAFPGQSSTPFPVGEPRHVAPQAYE